MKSRLLSALMITTALAWNPPAAAAQEPEADTDTIDIGQIVVRGDKVGRDINQATAGTTVIDGDEAGAPENIEIDEAVNAQPNVLANEGFSLPSIRGVDSTSGGRPSISAGSQPRTPILVDNVAQPSNESSAISQVSTWDISSVEVARGPQPTSTGRNAFGGAIRIFTNDPVYDMQAALRFGYLNEDDVFSGAFMVNAPLIEDELAIRITGEGSLGQSYVDILPTVPAGFDPEDERFGRIRGKLLYEPRQMPGLSLLFSVDHVENEQPTQGLVNDVDNIRIDNTNPFALVSSYEDVTQTVYQAKSTYEINDRLTWVSRVAYLDNELLFRDTEDVLDFGFPFVLGATGFDKSQIEAETYLQFGEYGIMRRGVVGVIHNTEHEDGFNTGTLEFSADGRIANTGIYGEVEISADELVEGLTFVAGGRLEIDDRFRRTQAPLGNPVGDIDLQATEFLPKLGVRYEPTENTAVGYTYSRGFRAGGLDVDLTAPIFQLPLSTSAFGPEFIDQHEIYARGSFLDGRLNLSAAGFYYVWDDAQVEGAAQFLGGAVSLIGNVPEAVGFGAEFAAVFAVSPQLSITGSLGLLDTEITDPGADLAEFDGAALPRAPEVTVSAGIAWTPIEDLIAKFDVRHIGSTVSALGQPEMSSYTVADVSLGHRFAAGSTEFQVQGFVKNLLDERYETFKELSQIGLLSAVGRPRTFGVALTARW